MGAREKMGERQFMDFIDYFWIFGHRTHHTIHSPRPFCHPTDREVCNSEQVRSASGVISFSAIYLYILCCATINFIFLPVSENFSDQAIASVDEGISPAKSMQ